MRLVIVGKTVAVLGEKNTEANDFESLYTAHFRRLVGLAEWIVGSAALAEEIVQETFVRLVESPPRLDDETARLSYVRSAVMNRCRSRVRRLVLERRHADRIQRESTLTIEDERPDAAVRSAVATLPMRQRQCVVLRFYDDLTVDQIASTLDLSSGTVKTHLHRALANLSTQLSEGANQ